MTIDNVPIAVGPNGPFALAAEPIHLTAALDAQPVTGFDFTPASFGAYIGEHCTDDDPGRIAMIEHSTEDWKSWECHEAGDEVVILVSGSANFIQLVDGVEQHATITAGQAMINPAGVWHTADVIEPFSAVYLTPCPGTAHRPR